ncbi:hypothetical protein GCM10011360_13190 [Primorskyibacter flagellatus]|uniref:VPLPA-CTERM protein sorting domain-containing protein n=1 Tax=Primorskyibacter flagellatus TaxID=1387277 RepID=A0A917A473_9RHOB|nr:VPLPA-CTERM sorting domain-containing protein [Primorskyibacter flagellatus]GGE26165.1 hypothetical protein GCM10011360_13190 [Primorskyibacter flagellatus]
MYFKSIAAAALSAILFAAPALAVPLDPTDMRGLRSFGGTPLLLSFSAVKGGTEDRTIAHFDLSGFAGPVVSAVLHLSMQNQDPTLPSVLDIYNFAGDGTVSIDEFDTGTFHASLTGLVGSVVNPVLDITALFNLAIANGDSYLSFNLRNEEDEGRFFLSDVIDGVYSTGSSAGPTYIDVTAPAVPLPAGAVLAVTGLGALTLLRRRRRV